MHTYKKMVPLVFQLLQKMRCVQSYLLWGNFECFAYCQLSIISGANNMLFYGIFECLRAFLRCAKEGFMKNTQLQCLFVKCLSNDIQKNQEITF